MLVSKIAPYSGYPSYTKIQTSPAIKASQTDSVSFKGSAPRVLSEEFVKAANTVIAKVERDGMLKISLPPYGECEAKLGEVCREQQLFLSAGKLGYIIKLNNDKVIPYSEFSIKYLPSGGLILGKDISLKNPNVYKRAVEKAKVLLDALATGENEHAWQAFPTFQSPNIKPKQPTKSKRRAAGYTYR